MLNLLPKIYSLKRSEQLTFEQIKILQKKRLHKLLRHILMKSKFYKNYYQKYGVTLDTIENVELKDLPPLTKKIMMDNYDDLVCDPLLKKEELEPFVADSSNQGKKYKGTYHAMHTSGTTGDIGIFVYGPDDWAAIKAQLIVRVSKTKINFLHKTKLALVVATDGNFAGVSISSDAPKPLFDVLAIHINSPLKEITQKLNDFQPDTVTAYASGAYIIAKEQLKGNLDISPKRVTCSADSLTPEMRAVIRQAFAVDPVNFYSATEALCMASECDSHHNMHLFIDWHVFEVVDKDLNPVKSGKPGNILVTNLYNYTQPLIRYEMGDEIILDDTLCPCGSPFPLVKSISGRKADFLWFDGPHGEEYIHPLIIGDFFVPDLEKFQIVQIQKNRLLIKAVLHGNKEKVFSGIQKKIHGVLTEKSLEKNVSFTIEAVEEIPNDPQTGKFRHIIPLK